MEHHTSLSKLQSRWEGERQSDTEWRSVSQWSPISTTFQILTCLGIDWSDRQLRDCSSLCMLKHHFHLASISFLLHIVYYIILHYGSTWYSLTYRRIDLVAGPSTSDWMLARWICSNMQRNLRSIDTLDQLTKFILHGIKFIDSEPIQPQPVISGDRTN